VIVGAGGRQRVYAFDSTLQNFTIVADSAPAPESSIRTTASFHICDSTLLPDSAPTRSRARRDGKQCGRWRRRTLPI
jgi:hypothetical protein